MSDTTASLRRKLDSARELQSVVRTMKSLAASSIGQYERSVHALADYYRTVELGLGVCLRASEPVVSMVVQRGKNEGRVIGAVVFGSDQGLVGQFNDVVAASAIKALSALPGQARVWVVGERIHASLAEAGLRLMKLFSVPNSVEGIVPLVGEILLESESGPHDHSEVTELHLLYNQHGSGPVYAPVSQRLLPLDEDWRRKLAERPWPTAILPEVMGRGTETLESADP